MAKKGTKKRIRRTPEQIIADLEAKIAQVKARAAAKETKAAPDGRALLTAMKAIDKALEAARDAKNEKMVRALEAGRAPLATLLVEIGVRLPEARARRKRRKKPGEAA